MACLNLGKKLSVNVALVTNRLRLIEQRVFEGTY
jgi:hypothetical protein